jgi:predicted permease
MWFFIIIGIFAIGGIIYKMGQTNNDTTQVVEGAAEGGCLFISLIQFFAVPLIIIIIIGFLIKSCN